MDAQQLFSALFEDLQRFVSHGDGFGQVPAGEGGGIAFRRRFRGFRRILRPFEAETVQGLIARIFQDNKSILVQSEHRLAVLFIDAGPVFLLSVLAVGHLIADNLRGQETAGFRLPGAAEDPFGGFPGAFTPGNLHLIVILVLQENIQAGPVADPACSVQAVQHPAGLRELGCDLLIGRGGFGQGGSAAQGQGQEDSHDQSSDSFHVHFLSGGTAACEFIDLQEPTGFGLTPF